MNILFPHRKSSETVICDGFLYKTPSFCKRMCQSKQCYDFYESFDKNDELKSCPYGFGVYRHILSDEVVFLCGLNIEKVTNIRDIRKRLSSSDWLPRMPYQSFLNCINPIVEQAENLNQRELAVRQGEKELIQDQQLLNDTLHEIRKLNAQIKASVEQLSMALSELDGTKEIDNIRRNLEANSNLLSLRLNTYDMVINPDTAINGVTAPIPIFKKIEKMYKCLYALRKKKNIEVNMHCSTKDESTFNYRGKDNLELGFFIIVENAMKYSLENRVIDIEFEEYSNRLIVRCQNWGIRIKKDELQKITQRGYRAKMVVNKGDIPGSGLGLYLLAQICEENNVGLNFKTGDDRYCYDGWQYSPFIVELIFQN